jgi:hypothetical protein
MDGAAGDAPIGGTGGDLGSGGIGSGGSSGPGTGGTVASTDSTVTVGISVSPKRMLDLVFMIDNSPSMTPKQEKLKAQFPKLLDALTDPVTGALPDLHIAIIDSDLGTGGAYPANSTCGPNASNGNNTFGDKGKFQMRNATACGVADPNAMFLDYANGKPVNFSGDINTVFACLAGGVGTSGCGQEHQLQAFEWALINLGQDVGNETQQKAFLRPQAHLGLVFLTDEDDCSAATNDGMFGVSPGGADLSNESASLRCATRAHQCGGVNLASSKPGYPAAASFSADFNTCGARSDSCKNPTNLTDPTSLGVTDTSDPNLQCSPLKDVKLLADEIRTLKPGEPGKVLVAGIFGWPRIGTTPLPYKIDLAPNPSYTPGTTAKPEIYDYWPVCYDPYFMPKNGVDTWDSVAVGNGATGGLRLSAFVDQFGDRGLKYSICEPDYKSVLTGIGNAIARKLSYSCLDYKLVDTDSAAPGLQPDCHVNYRTPILDSTGTQIVGYNVSPQALLACADGATPDTISEDCWQIQNDQYACPSTSQYMNVLRTREHIKAGPFVVGTEIQLQCRVCPSSGAMPAGCNY